ANCDQLFWAGNVGSGSHDRSKPEKSSERADVFRFAPDSGPHDLRITPAVSSLRTPPSRPRAIERMKGIATPLGGVIGRPDQGRPRGKSACVGECLARRTRCGEYRRKKRK